MATVVVLLRGDGSEADRRRTVDALERNTANLDRCCFDANDADSNFKLNNALVSRPRSPGHRVGVAEAVRSRIDSRGRSCNGRPTRTSCFSRLGVPSDRGGASSCGTRPTRTRWSRRRRQSPRTCSRFMTDRTNLRPTGDSSTGAAMGEPLWGCVYVRREALNIASGARWSFQDREDTAPLPLEEFVLVPGLVHVLAATVVTRPAGQDARRCERCSHTGRAPGTGHDRGRDRAAAGHCRPALLRVPVDRHPGPRIESRRVARAAG